TTDWAIIVQTRIPRVLLAAVVGAALAAAGAAFQGLLANPLADPHVLGVSGGAAIASYRQAQGVLFWIMGALSSQSYALVAVAGSYAAIGVVALLRHAAALNVLAAGEESAAALGVETERVRRAVFLAAALLVGAAVSVSGMISFVGLIVPHVLRLLLGPDLRLLIPASFLGGAVFLVWADTLARTV